jgi:hypothetical protein
MDFPREQSIFNIFTLKKPYNVKDEIASEYVNQLQHFGIPSPHITIA